jgi:hypothetical protein
MMRGPKVFLSCPSPFGVAAFLPIYRNLQVGLRPSTAYHTSFLLQWPVLHHTFSDTRSALLIYEFLK